MRNIDAFLFFLYLKHWNFLLLGLMQGCCIWWICNSFWGIFVLLSCLGNLKGLIIIGCLFLIVVIVNRFLESISYFWGNTQYSFNESEDISGRCVSSGGIAELLAEGWSVITWNCATGKVLFRFNSNYSRNSFRFQWILTGVMNYTITFKFIMKL